MCKHSLIDPKTVYKENLTHDVIISARISSNVKFFLIV